MSEGTILSPTVWMWIPQLQNSASDFALETIFWVEAESVPIPQPLDVQIIPASGAYS